MRLLIPFLIFTNFAAAQIFIRVNQLGFLPEDNKSAVVISNIDISNKDFKLRENGNGKIILKNSLMKIDTTYGTFNHIYRIDFSEIQKTGTYYLEVEGSRSHNFSIAYNLYHKVVDELMKFYPVQRCGYTDPKFHDICHKADSHKLINGDKVIEKQVDVTGGWHDAGDYAKFINTISFTTYMLLFSYEFATESML